MANHKRKKPKNSRAGCLMCKDHKVNGVSWQCRYPRFASLVKAKQQEGWDL